MPVNSDGIWMLPLRDAEGRQQIERVVVNQTTDAFYAVTVTNFGYGNIYVLAGGAPAALVPPGQSMTTTHAGGPHFAIKLQKKDEHAHGTYSIAAVRRP